VLRLAGAGDEKAALLQDEIWEGKPIASFLNLSMKKLCNLFYIKIKNFLDHSSIRAAMHTLTIW